MIIHGTITQKMPDGTDAECAYVIDLAKSELVQVGGESEITAENVDLIMEMMSLGKEMFGPDSGYIPEEDE